MTNAIISALLAFAIFSIAYGFYVLLDYMVKKSNQKAIGNLVMNKPEISRDTYAKMMSNITKRDSIRFQKGEGTEPFYMPIHPYAMFKQVGTLPTELKQGPGSSLSVPDCPTDALPLSIVEELDGNLAEYEKRTGKDKWDEIYLRRPPTRISRK